MTTLDDDASIQILKTIAQARLRADATGLADSPDLRAALAEAFGKPSVIAASEGDVARARHSTSSRGTQRSPSLSGS